MGLNMKQNIKIAAAMLAILVVCFGSSILWLDKKSWDSYIDNRWAIKWLAAIYDIYPFASKEDNVRRTIKIAHFLALSQINKKTLENTLLDFNDAQNLIDHFIKKQTTNLETEAFAELTLERLVLLNRMIAILLQSNRPLPINTKIVKHTATELLLNLSEGEVKQALKKEIQLYDINWINNNLINNNSSPGYIKSNLVSAIDLYHYGLAVCAMHHEFGANLIELGLEGVSKGELIWVTLRNVDHPLIAAASFNPDSECAVAVDKIQEQLRR